MVKIILYAAVIPVVIWTLESLRLDVLFKKNRQPQIKMLYVYMISIYEYSDSEFTPLFNKKKYSEQEFTSICNEIKNRITDNLDDFDFKREFIKIAVNEYGFQELDILEFNVSERNVDYYLGTPWL